MKNSVRTALFGFTALLLSGCGSIVGSFVGPQKIGDPLGLEGKTLTTDPFDTLRAAAVSTRVTYTTETPFDDVTVGELPLNLKPYGISLQLDVISATATGTQCVAPSSATLVLKDFAASVYDKRNPDNVARITAQNSASLSLKLRPGSPDTYDITGGTVNAAGNESSALLAFSILIGTDKASNIANVSANITSTEDGLKGCSLTFTMKNVQTTLSNFK